MKKIISIVFALALICANEVQAGEIYAASVTINGETTYYATLMDAWAYATNNQDQVDVSVKLLQDAAVSDQLIRTVENVIGLTMTLDLNDHVLTYSGEGAGCFIQQKGGTAMHIVDTAASRTPRYFTRDDATGLWTLTKETTDLVVSGGLITGTRAGAASFSYGSGLISNVNFVGNCSVNDGGAVSASSGTLKIFNANFFGNVTSGSGGAIYAGTIYEITDCCVEGNAADKQGGGIYSKIHGSLVRTRVVGNRAGTDGGGVYLTKASACLAAGTKILMADGTERSIENIVEGDVIATFDHEGGTNASAEVCLAYSGSGTFPAVTLAFASGATLTIIDCHDLLMEATRKYVTLTTENAADFIGARFYNYKTASWDELTGMTAGGNRTALYSIYTTHHLNCVANGLLTVADDVDWYLNIYELDESLKADAEQLAADIEKFGLVDINEYPVLTADPKAFDDFNTRYAYIAMGKGLVTEEALWKIFEETDLPKAAKTASLPQPKLMMAAPMMMLGASVSIPAPPDPYLKVGEGAVITGNTSTASAVSNVYLDKGKNAVIDVLNDATGVNVGVTLSSGADIFGWTNAVNYAAAFSSDNPNYSVSYTADGVLALRAGIQVGGDAWATIADGVCTIDGTGVMWNYDEWKAGNPLTAYRGMISEVKVSDGITSVGSHVFHKFYLVTNVTCAASVTTVGDYAFFRCHSLEKMSFDSDEVSFGEQSYTLQTGIRIKDGMPDIYPIPGISIAGYTQVLVGKRNLTDTIWTDITTEAEKANYNFFKIELRK